MHYERMPFGKKWRDAEWDVVDTSYLQWILYEDAGANVPGLHDDVREELIRRGVTPYVDPARAYYQQQQQAANQQQAASAAAKVHSGVSAQYARDIVAAGRKAMARLYHPDINKAADALTVMANVNASADWLEAQINANLK